MTCYSPLKGYYSKTLTVNGKRRFVTDRAKSNDQPLEIPCGQCIGCKLQRSLDWAARIEKEASLYDDNCFVTLTYAPENLPPGASLVKPDHQNFVKRLKSAVRYKYGRAAAKKIRFFMCGEYGENLGRPHYHYILLNFDFPDKIHHRNADRGEKIFRSAMLEELWPYGFSEIGSVTFDSAAYVARYCTKKITGPMAESHYTVLDAETGEYITKQPEFTAMSLKPGIGEPWLQKFASDVYNQDTLVTRAGAKIRPPRYYDKRYEVQNPDHYKKVLQRREQRPVNIFNTAEYNRMMLDNTESRLKVKETVHKATVNSTLKRNLERI